MKNETHDKILKFFFELEAKEWDFKKFMDAYNKDNPFNTSYEENTGESFKKMRAPYFYTGSYAFNGNVTEGVGDIDMCVPMNFKKLVTTNLKDDNFYIEEGCYFNCVFISVGKTFALGERPLKVNIIFLSLKEYFVWSVATLIMKKMPFINNNTLRHSTFEIQRAVVKQTYFPTS